MSILLTAPARKITRARAILVPALAGVYMSMGFGGSEPRIVSARAPPATFRRPERWMCRNHRSWSHQVCFGLGNNARSRPGALCHSARCPSCHSS
ncbi:hypothetical protein C8Q80DRAFT_1156066 [Daedaleopsis nitida]|nr:hypothetical protein C8Q80DRAFT_1156066 [Daedaleopsis nitida]